MPPSIQDLSDEIRKIYAQDPLHAEKHIEEYLSTQLQPFTTSLQREYIATLKKSFSAPPKKKSSARPDYDELIINLAALLGEKISREDLSSADLPIRLNNSLSKLSTSIERLLNIINTDVNLHSPGNQLAAQDVDGEPIPLETIITKLRVSFLMTHHAFKDAAYDLVLRILNDLDPDYFEAEESTSLKFGPLRKAASYDLYLESYAKCKKWFDSGRFMEDFIRLFHNNKKKRQ